MKTRREFIRSAFRAVATAAALAYSPRVLETPEVREDAAQEPAAEFGYYEAAPEYVKWEHREGMSVALPYSTVEVKPPEDAHEESVQAIPCAIATGLKPEFLDRYREVFG